MAGIPHQSRLSAFEKEIAGLRKRRPPTPYRQVLRLLRQKHGVQISLHALYSFVQVRKKWERIHRSAAECAASSAQRPPRVSTAIKPATTVPVSAKAAPAHPVTAAPQPGSVPPPRKNPGARTLLKSSIRWCTSTGSEGVTSLQLFGLEVTISRRIVMNSKRFGKRHRLQRSVQATSAAALKFADCRLNSFGRGDQTFGRGTSV